MKYAIYIITNLVNAKQYVGITKDMTGRWSRHKAAKGGCPVLHSAIRKHGVENFAFTHVADAFDEEAAKMIERILIAEHNTKAPYGYNMTDGGDGMLNPTDEVKRKFSEMRKGVPKSEEHKAKISAGSKGKQRLKGVPKSEEHKRKTASSLMGNKNSLGRKDSLETIAKRKATRAINKAKKMKELA
jgi:group I intron endonuclease